ncbi:Major facilitator superfamily domain general substrate transporter [Penicillium soppii]|jgi:sugar porter (SP) family MFS transporter|uniref:Major facilitator superfamily domain general substrate transporter n=1 Tax=Penicillium soppii TaxID=69789 RepID=UPI002547DB8E|nr:Major facilitator superfamily domain general substrate transporter [Penicillium soppii]KAJ5852583.1 Major facilitator superfamily domain general substrate transporter [Penicillium soppii]
MWTTTFGLKGKKLHLAITFTSVVGFSLFGYDQGLMSGIISGTQFTKEFPPLAGDSEHVAVLRGAVTACYELGCFFGAIFTLMYGQKIGRTPLLVAGGLLMVLGTVISTAAFGPHWGLGQFVVGRVISGLGNGMDTATIPVWQSECSRAHNRGFLVCFEGAIIAVGTFIAYWIDFGLSYVESSVQWRFPVAFQILFAILVTLGALALPESPRWFVMQGHDQEALEVLAALNDSTVDSDDVLNDFNLMKADLKSLEGVQASNWKVLFTGGKTQNFQRMMIGCSGQFFQQFTGCNAAIYYSTLLFQQNLHMTGKLPLVLGGVFATVYALATIPSFFMIEKVGRRNLFLIGFLGQGLSFIITMGCLIDSNAQNAKGAVVGIFLFICFFAFTTLPLPWIYPPEINPLRTRTKAASASTCMNWITNFAVVMFTPVFSNQSDWGIYLFFALVNFIAIPFAYFFYVETAGRDLEEVDVIFAKAHIEKKWPFRVAQELPKLTIAQITEMQAELGLDTLDDHRRASEAEKAETAMAEKPDPAMSSGDSDTNKNVE